MRGDSIVIEEHHRQAAIALLPVLLEAVNNSEKTNWSTIAKRKYLTKENCIYLTISSQYK